MTIKLSNPTKDFNKPQDVIETTICRMSWTKKVLDREPIYKKVAQELGGVGIDFVNYLNLFFDVDGSFKYFENEKKIKEYDFYWIAWAKWIPFKNAFIYSATRLKNWKMIDERESQDNSKLSQIVFCKHFNIPIPKSLFFIHSKERFEREKELILSRFDFPFILKNPIVDRWEGVWLVKNEEELNSFLNKEGYDCYLIQEYIENDWDYRVLTSNEENWIFWVIKRVGNRENGEFRNNISQWWTSFEIEEIPEEIKNTTNFIMKNYNLWIAWIDFFIKNNKDKLEYYLIEINNFPQYWGFEATTGKSFPKLFLEYIKKSRKIA